MNKRGLIGFLVVVVVLLVVGFIWFIGELDDGVECVPASCCHATECVLGVDAPDCDSVACTMNCEPGTLDCGQGGCEYVDGECEVVWG